MPQRQQELFCVQSAGRVVAVGPVPASFRRSFTLTTDRPRYGIRQTDFGGNKAENDWDEDDESDAELCASPTLRPPTELSFCSGSSQPAPARPLLPAADSTESTAIAEIRPSSVPVR